MTTVLRLAVAAELENPAPAVAEANEHARDDAQFSHLVHGADRGDLLVVAMTTFVEARPARRQRSVRVQRVRHGVWIERAAPPDVERQLSSIAPEDFGALIEQLEAAGAPLERGSLADLFVHVELGPDLRRELAAADDEPG